MARRNGHILTATTLVMLAAGLLVLLVLRGKESNEHGLKLHVESLNDQRRARNRRLCHATAGGRKKLVKAFRHEKLGKGGQKDKSEAKRQQYGYWISMAILKPRKPSNSPKRYRR